MQFNVLMSYNSIDFKSYKELEALGLKVPFDPKSPDSNVYAYISVESSITLGKMKSICDSIHYAGMGDNFAPMVVSEYEVNKHLEKTIAVNLPVKGDNVRYSEYKQLVFSVINIEENIATIKHSLRNIDLILDIPLSNLAIVEEKEVIVEYTSTIFPELDKAIYIDVDSINIDTGKQFALIIRLKLLYKGYEVIFVNPDVALQRLLYVLKLSSLYGDLNNIVLNMGFQDLLYSHHLSYLEYLPNLLVMEQGKYFSYINEITINNLGFTDKASLKLFNAIRTLHNKGVIDQDINFTSLKLKINQSYDFVKGLYISYKSDINTLMDLPLNTDSDLEVDKQEGDINIDELTAKFDELKLHYYIDNIEYYIYILKS